MASNDHLPPRENALFKRIVKCYEQKQYKIGLKFAKQILSNPKFSEHGETLAMKGLIFSGMGKRDEAYEFVKKGLRNNLRSHVCWHTFGLLQRSDRKYDEAIKCYRNALKWDKDNLQILRDLSLLQIQMRDLDGYRDTRYHLFLLRPAQKPNWIGYAMAFHLLKDYDMALRILEEFSKTQPEQGSKPYDIEHSELLLYQNMVMSEAGLHSEALQHLEDNRRKIVDVLAMQETRAELLLRLGRREESEDVCRQLIERNSENCAYYKSLEEARSPATLDKRIAIYREFSEQYPRALAPKRLLLEIISGDEFRSEVDKYMVRALHKGVPPLFKTLRSLYSDPEKVQIFEELALGYVETLKSDNLFHLHDVDCEIESPTSLLWTYFYLAQHYDELRQIEKAFEFINLALDHTMTLIELYVVKAKICKHAGDIDEAVKCLDEAQSLDTADRYINSKCAKYMLRANMLKDAEAMCSKFTRDGLPAADNLHEMQCMWFEFECAALCHRTGRYGDALKKCHEMDRQFAEITEDQFDFHSYCMRRMTLQSYVNLLRLEDVLRNHPSYFRAAKLAIEIYLQLFDRPLLGDNTNTHADQENLSVAEQRKLRNKQRKKEKQEAQKKKEKQKQEEHQKPHQPNNKPKSQDPELEGPKEEELQPEKLAKPENPLEEALRFLKPLQLLSANRIETHILAFKIFLRKGKLLLMLQSIKRAYAIDKNNPQFHECLVQFMIAVKNRGEQPHDVSDRVLQQEVSALFGDKDAAALNSDFLAFNDRSLPHILAGSKMIYRLDESSKARAVRLATDLSTDLRDRSLAVCSQVLESLSSGEFGDCEVETADYRDKCRTVFPHAKIFSPSTPSAPNSVHEKHLENGHEVIGKGEIKDASS